MSDDDKRPVADRAREARAERLAGERPEDGSHLPDVPRIRLQAGSGVIIDHTLPLHEAIAHQWRNGELHRVDDDGQPWEGDQYDLSDAYDTDAEVRQGVDGEDEIDPEDDREPGDGPEVTYPAEGETGDATGEQPARPADDAPKKAWQDYAVSVGAVEASEAPRLTRQQLIDRSTPPELRPEGI